MSEEENEAIEELKELAKGTCMPPELYFKDAQTILSLIDKQEKEIEELKELLQGNLYEKYDYYKQLAGSYQANCISKDKIREKLKEIENGTYDAKIILKQLLEE